jgi:tetratricopeptide (TPR) repeat protein
MLACRAQTLPTQGKDAVMVRKGLLVFTSAVGLALSGSVRGDDAESKLRVQLAVQTALQQGRENLQRGDYQSAVYCLEKEIARVDGNRDYLNALREAYRGYVRDLQQSNRAAEARLYQERLKILDPGYHVELNAGRPASPPPLAEIAAQSGGPLTPPPRATETSRSQPAPPYVARPQMPEEPDDPFAEHNRAAASPVGGTGVSPAGEVLDRARRAFESKDYASANRLYEEANRLDSHGTAPYREPWAFCKLHAVIKAVNKAGWNPPDDAEKETLAALALCTSPELQRQGKELLRAIQDRRIEIRHVPAEGTKWAEVQTRNFSVVHSNNPKMAEQAARVAETTRSAVIRKWFGEDSAPWENKCLIFLYPDAEFYSRQTGEPQDAPGHSAQLHDKSNPERLVERRIYLHCDRADMLTHVLPHETTHVVLMGRFGRHFVPRWADEGIAVLSEPDEKIERYVRTLPSLRSKGELMSLAQLMTMKDYPERRLVTSFYVQSISLVQFLSAQQGGPRKFTSFLNDALQTGYETALQRHYGLRDFKELEARWSQAVPDHSSSRASLYPVLRIPQK